MKLPSHIGNLTNLRHLDIMGANVISEMPLRMNELKCLRTLSNFIVSKGSGLALKDLKNFKLLCGKLYISGLRNVTDVQFTRETILIDKKNLRVLILEWWGQADYTQKKVAEEDVLEMLQPHTNLKELTIKNYGGLRFSSWVGDPSFSKMTVLRLENCENCAFLPSLGLLSSLKDLAIIRVRGLKRIGSEIYGVSGSKPFQSLKTIYFEDLQKWERWDPIKESEHVEIFSNLCELSIINCPKLSGRLPDHLPSLQKLEILQCFLFLVSLPTLPMLQTLKVDTCLGMVLNSLDDYNSLMSISLANISHVYGLRQGFQKVESLKITCCESLFYLWQNEIFLKKSPQGLNIFTSLRELDIADCPSLVSFPEVSNLSELQIINCDALKSLPEGMMHSNPCLRSLHITGCHSLTFISRGQLPASLTYLVIRYCKKLEFVFDDTEDTSTSVVHMKNVKNTNTSLLILRIELCDSLVCLSLSDHLPATLKEINVCGCKSLTTLSSRGWLPEAVTDICIFACAELTTLSSNGLLPESLLSLPVNKCPKLESITERFDSNVSLRCIIIYECENLKFLPENLHKLSNLHQICISYCPNLVSFPQEGLPNTKLAFTIHECGKLQGLPNSMHKLNSLQEMEIRECPGIISFPEEGFPTNLTSIHIEGFNIYKALIEWGVHKFTSLRKLHINGCSDAMSFPPDNMPTSLIELIIGNFSKLKCLSSKGFQNLTSLTYMEITGCPKLTSFPSVGLPSSLLQLQIEDCPLLRKRCIKYKGRKWSKIAHIPCVEIDYNFIGNVEEEEGALSDDSDP